MGLAAAVSFSLCLWVARWALGTKALDGMIVVLAIFIVAVAIKILSVVLPSQSRRT